jgi:hypothetical protein
MHEARDASGDRIIFDASELAGFAQRFRQQGEEQTGAHTGFQHASPVKPSRSTARHKARMIVSGV